MTIFTFAVGIDGAPSAKEIQVQVEKELSAIVSKLKRDSTKWTDASFGPNDKDPFGALSLYGKIGTPDSVGLSKYPSPESLTWERPVYDDDHFPNLTPGDQNTEEEKEDDYGFGPQRNDETDSFCTHGRLFIDGSSSGDVVQGQLGDCWFLGALAVMGSREELILKCFWKLDSFKEYGLYVCVFYKDCSVKYVVIDDRLPIVSKTKRLIFSSGRDPNELWVPLIEKAYAKLHGCYRSLIGGYSHYALGDLTGFSPRMIGLKPGTMGFSEELSDEHLWSILSAHKSWGSLMGCSIQATPGSAAKVEADAGCGLHTGHAYSLLDLGEITLPDESEVKLLKLRNPWGKGEWEGPWSDRSEEREKYDVQIVETFGRNDKTSHELLEVNFQDGTFFMSFADWRERFTSLFMAATFPNTWIRKRITGQWEGDIGGK